jgi:hypothetical protein
MNDIVGHEEYAHGICRGCEAPLGHQRLGVVGVKVEVPFYDVII